MDDLLFYPDTGWLYIGAGNGRLPHTTPSHRHNAANSNGRSANSHRTSNEYAHSNGRCREDASGNTSRDSYGRCL
jgi:hypothetical protein